MARCSDPAFPPAAPRGGVRDDAAPAGWAVLPCEWGQDAAARASLEHDNATARWGWPGGSEAEQKPFAWETRRYHFDSFGPALLASFTIATGDGLYDMAWAGVDAVGPDLQPETNHSLGFFWFFFGGVTIFGFYFSQLFIQVAFSFWGGGASVAAASEPV